MTVYIVKVLVERDFIGKDKRAVFIIAEDFAHAISQAWSKVEGIEKICSIEEFVQDGAEIGQFDDNYDESFLNGRIADIQQNIESTVNIDNKKRMTVGEDLCY